jgi:DNA polymerase-1
MQQRWAGHQLFSYGGALARLRGTRTEPLDKDSFANWLAETVAMYSYKPPGQASPGQYTASWPDNQTMGAILARGDEFPELVRVSRTPFARPDGSICAKNGYDADTGTMLVMGNSGMDRLDIPDEPSRDQAAAAARYLADWWLGNASAPDKKGIAFRDEPSRANALALVLTSFIRGIVPLVPLAVVSGLQPGVGKNLLADCISRLISGEDLAPLPWMPDDDEENAKKILSAFREGTSLMCFDEAHLIGGASLTRAITSVTYTDRILGVSKMASYPNKVTWMALGNQVAVLADMARRAYFIEIYPDGPDPQDRDESQFAHPDIREWTLGSRPELVTAALILIRAWFTAGQPAYSRGSLMGSFERWDKMMSGILGYAGVDGFLANLAEKRTERDTSGGFWGEHLAWLWSRFSSSGFTSVDVRAAAMASGGTWEAPPHLEDPGHPSFARNLGVAYSSHADRWFGNYRLVRGEGSAHRNVAKWYVQEGRGGTGGTVILTPGNPTEPVGGTGGTCSPDVAQVPDVRNVPGTGGVQAGMGGLLNGHTLPDLGEHQAAKTAGNQAVPTSPAGMPVGEGDGGMGGTSIPQVVARAGAGARAHARTYTRGGVGVPPGPAGPSTGPALGFDIETADADDLFRWDRSRRDEDGTGYVRLCGIIGPGGERRIVTVRDLLAMTGVAGTLYGHNILGFDGPALSWHEGLDWERFVPRARDSLIIARQANPPRSRESGTSADRYDLDHVAGEMGLPGKTDSLPRLARKHGGYHLIPAGDEEYRSYLLDGDLPATAAVASQLLPHYDRDPYLPREHAVMGLAGRMMLNGFAVGRELLAKRAEQTGDRKRQALGLLHDGWGLPLDKAVMRGRGAARHEEREELDSPLAGKAGRSWLEQMYARYQVADPPRTGKSQDLAIGSDALAQVTARPGCPPELATMITLMGVATGARTVYQTATDWLCPDGRVHPKISMSQASGRWSFTKPGLTVYGKHEGRHVEREIFTADPGHVLLSFDLAQVDMRAIAGHSQDPEYTKLFAPGRDAHTEIALRVFGTAKRRQDAKARGHGWNYGMGPDRMIRDGIDPGLAYGFDNGMKESFPAMCAWREDIRRMGKNGQILDNGFGRRMRCDPHWAYTVAPALMGQGGARDIMCECLLRLPAWLHPFMRGMVHDEIIFSVPAEIIRDVVRIVTQAMTWVWAPPGALTGVPILCDVNGPGRSWGGISGKCAACGKGQHEPEFCELATELSGLALSMQPSLLAQCGYSQGTV